MFNFSIKRRMEIAVQENDCRIKVGCIRLDKGRDARSLFLTKRERLIVGKAFVGPLSYRRKINYINRDSSLLKASRLINVSF